jgi:nucleoid-associated protein YgaU
VPAWAETGDDHGDTVRARAEELAEQASRRFAQLSERAGADQVSEAAEGEAADALSRWLAHSDRLYRALVQRLARAAEALPPGPSAPARPGAAVAEPSEGAGAWLMRSRALFAAAVRRLSGRTLPAPVEAVPAAEEKSPPAEALGAKEMPKPVDSAAAEPVGSDAGRERREAEGGEPGRPLALRRRAAAPAKGAAPRAAGPVAAVAEPPRKRVAPVRQGQAAEGRRNGQAVRGGRVAKSRHPSRHVHEVRRGKARHAMRHARALRGHRCRAAGRAVALPGWYVVAKGDTLSAIALRHYGAAQRYRQIAAANRHRLRSRNLILPCQRLYLPRTTRRG